MTFEYLAGVIDADGSIYIRKKKNKMIPSISITSTKLDFLFSIKDFLEENQISSRLKKKPSKNPNASDCFDLTVDKVLDCQRFIGCLNPFIRLKIRQLGLLTCFFSLKEKMRPEINKNHFSENLLIATYSACKSLNARGVKKYEQV